MADANIKKDVLALTGMVRRELDDLIKTLSPQDKLQKGNLRRWSAKDMLVHLAFWEKHFNRQVEAGLSDKHVPASGDYLDQINDGVLYEHMDQPFEDARAEEADAYQEFLKLLEEMPEEDLTSTEKFAFLEGRSLLDRVLGSYGYHPLAHLSDYYVKAGQVEKARHLQETLTGELSRFPTWKANAVYNLACFYALNGWKDEAIEKLKIAFTERPELIVWAAQDSDLDALREMGAYKELMGK